MERRPALRADLRRRPAEHQPCLPHPARPCPRPGPAALEPAGIPRPVRRRHPRNLFGHKDGTANPRPGAALDDAVWAGGPDEPAWFTAGTYLVFRKIRMDLPKWDTSTAQQQDQSIGRRRDTGAPLSGGHEFTPWTSPGPDRTANPSSRPTPTWPWSATSPCCAAPTTTTTPSRPRRSRRRPRPRPRPARPQP
ncbi:Dyp-type peroxidase [Nonomuraea thailandensis]